mmetsp:Transcript_22402/g.52876  ORF Transcript_22402/g.52876 Transcript_22402/m.52876 type:complete len:259 (-) Transcript_22402:927-1703(-)
MVTAPSMHATMPSTLASAPAAMAGTGCPANATLHVSTADIKAARRVPSTLSRMTGGLFLYIVMAPSMHAIVASIFAGSALAAAGGSGAEATAVSCTGAASNVASIAASTADCVISASSLNMFETSPTKPSNRSTSGPFKRPLPNAGPPRCLSINPISVRIFCFLPSVLEVTVNGLGSSTSGATGSGAISCATTGSGTGSGFGGGGKGVVSCATTGSGTGSGVGGVGVDCSTLASSTGAGAGVFPPFNFFCRLSINFCL